MKKAAKKAQFNVRLSPDCIKLIKRNAKKLGISHSAVIEIAVREWEKANG